MEGRNFRDLIWRIRVLGSEEGKEPCPWQRSENERENEERERARERKSENTYRGFHNKTSCQNPLTCKRREAKYHKFFVSSGVQNLKILRSVPLPVSCLVGLAVLWWRRNTKNQEQEGCSQDPQDCTRRSSSLYCSAFGRGRVASQGQKTW